MKKKGSAKKFFSVMSFALILLVVTGIISVSSQEGSVSDVAIQVKEKLQIIGDGELQNVTQQYVEKFVEKRGVNVSDINNVSEVNFEELPQEVKIDNANDANLVIYNVNYNDTKDSLDKQVYVVTYSTKKLESTKDLIAYPDKRQFLSFGLVDESSGSFLNTAAGVPGSLNAGYVMMRQGSITGISTNLEVIDSNEDVIDVVIYKNGEKISFGNTLNSGVGIEKDYDTQSKGVVTFEPGDTISIQVVSTSGSLFKNVITQVEITTVE